MMRLIMVSGARLGLAGCGAVAAIFATRLISSMLFQVEPMDPAVIALAASIIPARRAASIEPMQALKEK